MCDVDLSQRLHFAENDFLTALESGTNLLASYHHTWSTLSDNLSSAALESGTTSNETFSLVHFVASRISNIAKCYLDVKLEEESFASQLHNDCDAMLRQMNALNLNTQVKSLDSDSTPRFPQPSTLNEGTSSSPLPCAAYRWLLDNLHNPYPTAEVKTRIAVASSCLVSSINSWFITTRRRIGWTTLCRESFSNCRADMIDAAYRALVEEDPQRMLSPELRHSFIAMKVAAESLYSSITSSAFPGDLDAVVKDLTDGHKESVEVRECSPVKQANPGKTAEHLYPSPARSIAESPIPALDDSLTDESEEEGDVAPAILAGSKRRRSSIEPENQPPPAARRPIKRLRASMTSQTRLPSPPSSTDGIESILSGFGPPRLSSEHFTQSQTNKALPSRKQRVSDIDDSGIPKLPGGLTAVPVEYPLPCPNIGNESIDDWFNTNFDSLFTIPPPVDATEPDFSTSWEVELFKDYSIPDNLTCGPKWHPPPVTDTDVSAVAHLSEFDSLLQSIASDTYVAPLDSMLPSNITGAPHTGFLDPSIPDISHIDWTSLLDGSDAYQSTIDSTFSQYPTVFQPLPDMDLSMLQLPPFIPTAQSHGDLASKRVKLDQFHAMQEAVRRMEQELQLEGVIL